MPPFEGVVMTASLPQLGGFCPDLREIDDREPDDLEGSSRHLRPNQRLERRRFNQQHQNRLSSALIGKIERISQYLATRSQHFPAGLSASSYRLLRESRGNAIPCA